MQGIADLHSGGVASDDLQRIAGPERVEGGDALWSRIEHCEICAPRKDTSLALSKALCAWSESLLRHEASGNFRNLLQNTTRLLARCTSSCRLEDRDVIAALNYVVLVRSAAKVLASS